MTREKKRRTQGLYSPRARRFCLLGLFACEIEPLRLKGGVAHGLQLIKGLTGQRRHILVHLWQNGLDCSRCPAPVTLMIHTNGSISSQFSGINSGCDLRNRRRSYHQAGFGSVPDGQRIHDKFLIGLYSALYEFVLCWESGGVP